MTSPLTSRLIGRPVVAVRRVFHLFEGAIDRSEGALDLVVDDLVVHFRSGPNGQALVIEPGPWVDPFAPPLSRENAEYLATHGKWTSVDVSHEPGWREAIGEEVRNVSPIRSDAFGEAVTISLSTVDIEVEVVADELHARAVGRAARGNG